MLNLEVDHPEIYDAIVQGNFSVQLNEDNILGRMETNKVIETTINKNTKKLRCCFHRHLGYVNAQHKHHNLTLSRIKRDEKDVQSLMEVMTNTFIDPLSDNDQTGWQLLNLLPKICNRQSSVAKRR